MSDKTHALSVSKTSGQIEQSFSEPAAHAISAETRTAAAATTPTTAASDVAYTFKSQLSEPLTTPMDVTSIFESWHGEYLSSLLTRKK